MKHKEYNGISKGRFNRATTSEEEIERMLNKDMAASWRSALLAQWRSSGLTKEAFIEEYNSQRTCQDISAELGYVSLTTFYRWINRHESLWPSSGPHPLMTYNGMRKERLLGKGLEPTLEGGE
jgi:hypothetical protein